MKLDIFHSKEEETITLIVNDEHKMNITEEGEVIFTKDTGFDPKQVHITNLRLAKQEK